MREYKLTGLEWSLHACVGTFTLQVCSRRLTEKLFNRICFPNSVAVDWEFSTNQCGSDAVPHVTARLEVPDVQATSSTRKSLKPVALHAPKPTRAITERTPKLYKPAPGAQSELSSKLCLSSSTKLIHSSMDINAPQLHPVQPRQLGRCATRSRCASSSSWPPCCNTAHPAALTPNSASTDPALNRPSQTAAHWRRK